MNQFAPLPSPTDRSMMGGQTMHEDSRPTLVKRQRSYEGKICESTLALDEEVRVPSSLLL